MNRRRIKLRIPFTCVTLSKVFSFDLFEITCIEHQTSNEWSKLYCVSALLVSKKFLSNHINNANFQRIFKCHKTSDWDLNEKMAKMCKGIKTEERRNNKKNSQHNNNDKTKEIIFGFGVCDCWLVILEKCLLQYGSTAQHTTATIYNSCAEIKVRESNTTLGHSSILYASKV